MGNATALGSTSSAVYINGGTLDLNDYQLGGNNKPIYIQGAGMGGIGELSTTPPRHRAPINTT